MALKFALLHMSTKRDVNAENSSSQYLVVLLNDLQISRGNSVHSSFIFESVVSVLQCWGRNVWFQLSVIGHFPHNNPFPVTVTIY
mmetsp:Transcript_37602/g.76705  ORF Transcript_37602/g.76705 Transcript_37602/m.76705 type:complete len:85 (-) Transcript_37602:138-392(-)